jgi:hypothetical protein
MKDALGHGSNPHGAHAEAINRLPRSGKLTVSKNDFKQARTAQGQVDTRIKQVWQKVSGPKRRAVAERIAQHQRVDNPNSLMRLR